MIAATVSSELVSSKPKLSEEIRQLKREKNAIILAHYYQVGDIQDVADYVGDSLELSRKAASTSADVIVFCGVHFMAETAKILSPEKKVLLPDIDAGCSLSDSCPPDLFRKFKSKYPEALVISYINCSAEIKALSDIICTSSNAEFIVNSIPKETPIIFAPDKYLGKYLVKKTGRDMILWDGSCMVHDKFVGTKTAVLLDAHPEAKFIAHPESPDDVLALADFIGSTSQMLKFVQTDNASKYIVATENGIFHQMEKTMPNKIFISAACDDFSKSCVCGICPHMKKNTIEKLYRCLKDESPAIHVDEDIRLKALTAIQRMLELSKAIK